MTDDGENFTVLGMFGVTVNVLLTVVPFAAAEIFTVVLVVTTFVVTVKVAVELPVGTITEAGMDTTAELPLVTVNVTNVSMPAYNTTTTNRNQWNYWKVKYIPLELTSIYHRHKQKSRNFPAYIQIV